MFHQRTASHAAMHGFTAEQPGQRTRGRAAENDDEGPGLLVSPAFWIGGVLSLGVWVALAAAFGVI